MKEENFLVAAEAYDSLSLDYDLIVLEGAGRPAEINLMAQDIVNMRMAEYAGARTILVGDISRGGVFAALKGTIDLVGDRYRSLISGMIINKFRGDMAILAPGIAEIERITGKAVLGTIPHFEHNLEDEDSLDHVSPLGKGNQDDLDKLANTILRNVDLSGLT
jgi:adenosylcobyric acid synthase